MEVVELGTHLTSAEWVSPSPTVYPSLPAASRLWGYKWFTSAADGEMAFALGRECGPGGRPIPGNRGLSMFFVPIRRDAHGAPEVRLP